MKVAVSISRVLVGLLFIVSGFVKVIDPLGFSYKLDKYFVVFSDYFFSFFGSDFMMSLTLPFSVFFTVLEMVLGFALLIGVFRKLTTWLMLLLIIFFTFLTGFTAITGEVTDCGCFGDALKLTPWQSFYKDIVLTALILIIFFGKKHIEPIIRVPAIRHTVLGVFTVASFGLSIYCLAYLPIIDFRPYEIGAHMPTKMNDGVAPEIEPVLVYKNTETGEVKEFSSSNLPSSDGPWEFKERRDKTLKEGKLPTIHDFSITGEDGKSYTDQFLNREGYLLVIIAHDISKTNKDAYEDLRKLAKKADDAGIKTIGLSSSSFSKIDDLRHEVQLPVTFYQTDGIQLKTMIRSNPGLMLWKEGTILGKWPDLSIPAFKTLKSKYNIGNN